MRLYDVKRGLWRHNYLGVTKKSLPHKTWNFDIKNSSGCGEIAFCPVGHFFLSHPVHTAARVNLVLLTYLLTYILVYVQMLRFLLTYCNANNAITHSHAATIINIPTLDEWNSPQHWQLDDQVRENFREIYSIIINYTPIYIAQNANISVQNT